MAEIEIGMGKSARRAYGFDELTIVPSRRTRDPRDVDITWEIDAYKFDLPMLASPLDSVVSPRTAIEIGRLGGLGILNLEGLWTRYEDPEPVLQEIARLPRDNASARMQALYAEPIKETLIKERISEIKAGGVVTAASLTPQLTEKYAKFIADAELDMFIIHGTVVSAEHVSRHSEPLNLKRFIREFDVPTLVGGCASYQAALHLMRTGAQGILVGVGSDETSTTRTVLGVGTPQATAVADGRAARMRHLDETGVYCHVIAAGGIDTAGDVAKAVVCGADAVMVGTPLAAASEAPGGGANWSMSAVHSTLPRGQRLDIEPRGSLQEILFGPAKNNDGHMNIFGALRSSMAMTGYESLKDFQKAEVMVQTQEGMGR